MRVQNKSRCAPDSLMPVHLAVQMTWRPVDLVKDSHPIRAVTFDSKDRQT